MITGPNTRKEVEKPWDVRTTATGPHSIPLWERHTSLWHPPFTFSRRIKTPLDYLNLRKKV